MRQIPSQPDFLLQTPNELPPLVAPPQPQPNREPMRRILLGSRDGVQQTIHQFHWHLGYIEQFHWSQLSAVPASGVGLLPTRAK